MKPDGGPAFPMAAVLPTTTHTPGVGTFQQFYQEAQPGMSLRDYFAAAALQGIIAHGSDAQLRDMAERTRGGGFEAAAAYAWADAMLAERGKKAKP